MQKLHLVGFTADFDGLIFSTRKGARSGSFVVPLDSRLLKQIAEAERHRDGGDPRVAATLETRVANPRPARPESALTPREMQDRLRAGWTLDEVAEEAGVDAEWVARFAAPVLAEVRRVVEQAQASVFDKPRFGESALPLGASVRRNVAERGVALTDEDADDAWSAYQAGDDLWVVRFAYRSRGRAQEAEWLYDVADDDLVARNRLGSQLGHVTRAKGRTRPAPSAASAVRRPTPQKRRAATRVLAAAAASSPSSAGSSSPSGTAAARPPAPTKAVARKAAPKKAVARKAAPKKAARKAAPTKAVARKAAPKKAAARTAAPARKTGPAKAPGRKAAPAKVAVRKAAPVRPSGRRTTPTARKRTTSPAARRAPKERRPASAPALIEAPVFPVAAPAKVPDAPRPAAPSPLDPAPVVAANGSAPEARPPAPDTGPQPRVVVFDDLAVGSGPRAAAWAEEHRGPLPPPPATPVPERVREAVATPIVDAELDPPKPGAVAIDEETGIARIDSRRMSHYVSLPAARSPVFRHDVTRAGPSGDGADAGAPGPGPRRPRRSEPLRGR